MANGGYWFSQLPILITIDYLLLSYPICARFALPYICTNLIIRNEIITHHRRSSGVSSPSQWHFDTFCKLFSIETTEYNIELATVIYKHNQPINHFELELRMMAGFVQCIIIWACVLMQNAFKFFFFIKNWKKKFKMNYMHLSYSIRRCQHLGC